jgi:hypothetical protein
MHNHGNNQLTIKDKVTLLPKQFWCVNKTKVNSKQFNFETMSTSSGNNNNLSVPNATASSSMMEEGSVAFGEEFAPRILSISLNATCTAFAVGLENGYRVYGMEPLKELYRQGIRLV